MEKEIKRLYEMEALSVLPTKTECKGAAVINKEGKLIISNPNNGLISFTGGMHASREVLQTSGLGSDFYVDIDSKEEEYRDKVRTYAVDFAKQEDGTYKVASKNYYILRFDESDPSISDQNKKEIIKYARTMPIIYTTDEPLSISYKKPDVPYHMGYICDRNKLDLFMKNGIDKMPFKDMFEVYHQTENGFVVETIDEAMDIPKTFIKRENNIGNTKAKRMHLFFEYDPLDYDLVPDCIKNGNIVEFEKVGTTEDGLDKWKESQKLIQNKHNAEYASDLKRTGNRSYIEIDTHKISLLDLVELTKSGLVEEFELIESKNGLNYYVNRPLITTKEKTLN